MKLEILQENLNQALSLASRFISPKAAFQILNNFLIEAKKGELVIKSTNLENSLVINLPAKVEKEGRITLPAKTFLDLILSLPAGKVSLKQEKEKIAVVCGQIKAQINGLGAEEFPEIPGFKSKDSLWQMESTELFLICKEVAFAASADESRPALNAVWVKPEKDKMVFAATDGYRLSRREMPGKFQEDKPLLVPAKALKEVARIITGKEGRVKLAADKKQNQMIFLMQNIQVVSRLIEAEFPPFDKIIPQNCQTKIFFDRELLIQALKTAAIFARESANIIKFKIQNPALSAGRPASPVSTPNLKISANAPQIGENETEIEAKIKGETLEIAFNFRFIQEFLNSVEEDEIEAEFSGALSPALFRVKGKPDFIHIIMPVRVQAE